MASRESERKLDALIVFVTGIGQSFSYLFDSAYLRPDAFPHGTLHDYENYAPLIEQGRELDAWNIFAFRVKEGLGSRAGRRALFKTAAELVGSAVTRRSLLRKKTARQLTASFFALNKIDKNGDADPRVVSVVGCWQGSGVMTDLLDRAFIGSPKELIKKGILAEALGRKTEQRLRPILRLFSDKALAGVFDTFLDAVIKEIILPTPSLLALAPPETAERFLPLVPDDVRKEVQAYVTVQKSVRSRLLSLQAAGVRFSFVCGYGLPYGAKSADVAALGLLKHAKEANSDELIDISSTAPGVASVPVGQTFTDKSRRLSPDGSLDLTNAPFADSTWFFLRQKHELEDNNTALSLALSLALGEVEQISDCADPRKTPFYPQFNGARDLKAFWKTDLPRLNAFLSSGGTLTAAQQALVDETLAMTERTVNDEEKDRDLLSRFAEMTRALHAGT